VHYRVGYVGNLPTSRVCGKGEIWVFGNDVLRDWLPTRSTYRIEMTRYEQLPDRGGSSSDCVERRCAISDDAREQLVAYASEARLRIDDSDGGLSVKSIEQSGHRVSVDENVRVAEDHEVAASVGHDLV
jgi:hypothetical protein